MKPQKGLSGILRGHVSTPIAFSDEQLDAIMHAAHPLAPANRERFVEAVTAALQGRGFISPSGRRSGSSSLRRGPIPPP
jgi:hypothetical protein